MTKRTKITSLYLDSLRPGKDNGEIVMDAGTRGQGALVLRVTDFGKPIYYRHFVSGKRRFELIGYFNSEGARDWRAPTEQDSGTKGGQLTLRAAKEGFIALSQLSHSVGDLKEHYRREAEKGAAVKRAAVLEARIGSFQDLADVYVKSLQAAGKVSAGEASAVLRRNVSKPFPDMVALQARAITPEHIQEILAKIVARGTKRQVNVTRSYLRAAFQYAGKSHDYDPRRLASDALAFRLHQNPVDLVPRIGEYDKVGTTTLSAAEIRAYFELVQQVPSTMTRAFLMLHLLTGGQRPRQLLRAPWTSYDWTQPLVTLLDIKGRSAPREHLVPLHSEALAVLKEIQSLTGELAAPFMNRADTLLRLATIAKAVAEIASTKQNGKRVFSKPFTLRDIRRTVETRLVDLGVSKEFRSQLLSHDRGGKIEQTYNKNTYLPQKRAALRTWIDFLKGDNLGDEDEKVVNIHVRKQRGLETAPE